MSLRSLVWFSTWVVCASPLAMAQPEGFNYDEAKVPNYTLPDPLIMNDGSPVTTPEQWRSKRRPELVTLFEEQMYGRVPDGPKVHKVEVSSGRAPWEPEAIRKEVTFYFSDDPTGPSMRMLIYQPLSSRAVPLFLGLNFGGNQTIHTDPGISLNTGWTREANDPKQGIVDHRATDASRGTAASRWPVQQILARGYGVATIYCGDIDPDFDDGFQNGVHPLGYKAGQTLRTVVNITRQGVLCDVPSVSQSKERSVLYAFREKQPYPAHRRLRSQCVLPGCEGYRQIESDHGCVARHSKRGQGGHQ